MTEHIERECPFCGEAIEVVGTYIYTRLGAIPIIECGRCGAVFTLRKMLKRETSSVKIDEDDLYKGWNRRTHD